MPKFIRSASAAALLLPISLCAVGAPDAGVLRAPVVNAVNDYGDYTPYADSLSASWVVSGTNITEYRYAIGTSVGATNVVPWTSVGLNKSVTRTGLSLDNGRTYYFSVRAYNDKGEQGTRNRPPVPRRHQEQDQHGGGQDDGRPVNVRDVEGAGVQLCEEAGAGGSYSGEPGQLVDDHDQGDTGEVADEHGP